MTTRFVLAAALLLAVASVRGAGVPADGLYLSVQDTSAPSVRRQDGTIAFLGAKTEPQFLEKRLQSQGNANTSFSLSLTVPYDAGITPDSHVLLVAGTAYRLMSSGSSGQDTSSMHFPISGADKASEVASYFNIPVNRFRHPGHRLHVEFVPSQKSFARGEQVTATLRIANLGTEPVAFIKGGRNRAIRDQQYAFSAYRSGVQVPDIGNSAHSGGLSVSVVLQPGAIFEDTATLSHWFEFKEAGRYQLHGSYRLDFVNPGTMHPHFWTDYATAEFEIRID